MNGTREDNSITSERNAVPLRDLRVNSSLQERGRRTLRALQYPIAIALYSTVITFIFGYCTYLAVENAMPKEGWLGIWNQWDSVHYLHIAESGYGGEASGEQRFMIVFL